VYKQPHQFDARITLSYRDKIPYGTYAAYNFLSKEFPKAVIETNRYAPGEWKSLSHDSSKQVLLIITKFFNPSEDELDNLTGLVQKNNFVFISALQMNPTALKFFKLDEEHSFSPFAPYVNMHPFNPFDTLIVNLDDKTFPSPVSFQYPGADFSNEFRRTDSLFTFHLGYASSSKPDLAAINSKTGTIFLHAAPVAFTNFFLLYNDNHNYFEKLMSLLPADAKKIVWDEYFLYKRTRDQDTGRHGVLSVILRYPNFRWAFWIVLALISIYILTEIKRRQRIIPPYEKPVNDSLEFVTTIGKLYYEKGDHKNLAEKLTQYFLDHVRNRFKISTAEINSAFVQQLAAKSNKDISEINAITNSIHTIQLSNSITQKQLMEFYELLEDFYSKT
jgi:hypothetical protein